MRKGRDPITIEEMSLEDIPDVVAIEKSSFKSPWGERSFQQELLENPVASLYVIRHRRRGRILGFACVWIVDREVKINSLAIHPDWRLGGLGGRLLRFLLDSAVSQGCVEATLEVRPSNLEALRLYRSAGFAAVGRRSRYYMDSREDALVMALCLSSRRGG
jgi:ribosomal-protein-alanine N-acetyltransferase